MFIRLTFVNVQVHNYKKENNFLGKISKKDVENTNHFPTNIKPLKNPT